MLADACRRSSVPVFAIGGIARERIEVLRDAGAFGVAMIGGILTRENIGTATTEMCAVVRAAWPVPSRKRSPAR